MHVNGGILNISFAFALFFLLSYKLRMLIRSYLIPYLIQQKQALRRRYAEVIEKKKLVASTTIRVDSQIKNQQMEFVLLEKKMQVWHAALCREYALSEQENDQLRVKLDERRKQQAECLTAIKIAQESMQRAFQESYEELVVTYAGDKGKNLLINFVDKLTIK